MLYEADWQVFVCNMWVSSKIKLCKCSYFYILTLITFPTTTESIISGFTFPAASAAFEATSAKSMLVLEDNLPPKAPNGVRLAATINIPVKF